MKKGNPNKNPDDFKIFQCHILYDDIHESMESELLDLEQIELYIHELEGADQEVPDCLVEVHKDIVNNINNLLYQRLHSDK